jgi:hypothetical protein
MLTLIMTNNDYGIVFISEARKTTRSAKNRAKGSISPSTPALSSAAK